MTAGGRGEAAAVAPAGGAPPGSVNRFPPRSTVSSEPGWTRGLHDAGGERFSWNRVLWSLVYPQRRQRVLPTASGSLLILISLAIGMAAYNAANNILFITLSLLLACLVASGVLSWVNFRKLAWRIDAQPPMRVGCDAAVALSVRNEKQVLPTYALWFELVAAPAETLPPGRPESTFTARGADVRAALEQAERGQQRGRLALAGRLDPGAEAAVEWAFQPKVRGRLRIEFRSVGSLFPFGFLRKDLTTSLARETIIWPAPVAYRRRPAVAAQRTSGAERMPRLGSGEDLFALRRYQTGDSHRLIHWKASARTRQLLVRQFSAEAADGFALWLDSEGASCSGAEQYELLLRLAATLAEDLFRGGRLRGLALNRGAIRPARRLQELEAWLDELALLPAWERRVASPVAPATGPRVRNRITFAADGPRGVAAMVDGAVFASA